MHMKQEQIVGYVRVSTDDQSEHRTSLTSQEALIREDAESKNQIVVRMFVDAGESGQDARRPEFNRMLEFVENPANGVSEIKIFSLSRLGRNLETQVQTFARLKRAKVRLLSLTQSFTDDALGGMLRNLIASFDEYFALETGKHTRRTMRKNAEEGFFNGGVVPYGYESKTVEVRGTKSKKKLFIHPHRASVVRKVFGLATVGNGAGPMGARAIAEWLNLHGHTLANGNKFNNSNVTGILRRCHYRGHYFDMTCDENGGQAPECNWVRVECPSIISDKTMDEVAALRALRRPTVTAPRITNGPTLLTKIARCGTCGEGLTIRTGKGGRYAYYSCNKKVNTSAKSCDCPNIRQERLDAVVVSALERQIFEPKRLQMLLTEMLEESAEADARRATDLARTRQQKTLAETNLRKLYEALAGEHASLKDPVFTKLLAEHRERIASASARIETLERQIGSGKKRVTPELINAFGKLVLERLRGDDPTLRKAYVAQFVSQVTVDRAAIRISGSPKMLERAVGKTEPAIMGMVPIFDREWCPRPDSNRHSFQNRILNPARLPIPPLGQRWKPLAGQPP